MKMNEKHQACEKRDEQTLYRIGMFAALNRVTVKTLRFYEERGLLAPAFINEENGYRYYALSQMPDLHRITALKQAGFTLEEIALLKTVQDEKTVLYKKKSEILNQIAELTKQIAVIDGYIAKKGNLTAFPVLIKEIPSVTVAYMTHRIRSYDSLFDLMPEMGERMERAGCQCTVPDYCFTHYIEPGYKEEDLTVEICEAVVEAEEETDGLKFKEMPKIQAACAYHRGSYSGLHETYESLLTYIEENDYEIEGPIRENYIDGIWNKEREEDWLTEIQIPIRKKVNAWNRFESED